MAPIDADIAALLRIGPRSKLCHPGGVNMGHADGSVAFMKADTPAEVGRARMTIAGHDDAIAKRE